MKMDRRDFLGSVGLGGLGAVLGDGSAGLNLLVPKAAKGKAMGSCQEGAGVVMNPREVKVNLKPVMTNIIHSDVWEGPCRWKRLTVGEERAKAERGFIQWAGKVKRSKLNLNEENVRLLEPVHIKFSEDFVLSAEELNKLRPDSEETDAYFIIPWGSSFASVEIGKQFNKPIIMVGLSCRNVDIAAYPRSKGYEAFVPAGYDQLDEVISLLRARKVFTGMSVLFPTDRGLPPAVCVSSVNDLEELEERLGIVVKQISYKKLAEQMDSVMKSKSESEKAERFADELLRNARQSYIDRKYVVRSVQFYQTVKSLMARYGCNAFTIECFEFCASRLPERWKITPCLIHTLLKDEGFASSCEGDFGALLAMRLLMSVSKKSSHMGNVDPSGGNTFRINHSAPGVKMNGYDRPGLAYKLGRFVESGWGTKAVVNFTDNSEKRVTVARVNPAATKILLLKGELVGAAGWHKDHIGCSVEAVIKPAGGKVGEFLKKRVDYGNHLPWVYGDYAEQMQQLGEMLGLTVEAIT